MRPLLMVLAVLLLAGPALAAGASFPDHRSSTSCSAPLAASGLCAASSSSTADGTLFAHASVDLAPASTATSAAGVFQPFTVPAGASRATFTALVHIVTASTIVTPVEAGIGTGSAAVRGAVGFDPGVAGVSTAFPTGSTSVSLAPSGAVAGKDVTLTHTVDFGAPLAQARTLSMGVGVQATAGETAQHARADITVQVASFVMTTS